MKISVITITCRTEPRLRDMARTMTAAAARSNVELEWVLVDEKYWTADKATLEARVAAVREVIAALPGGVRERVSFLHVAPPETEFRGSRVPVPTPAHNSARNAGLAACHGSFVVFLNDCTVVTGDWLNVARDVAAAEKGWRCKSASVQDLAVPDGALRFRDHHDLLRPVPFSTVGGPCWGAPRAAFEKIQGFDVAYNGEDHGHELDAIIRLSRAGLSFVTTERALAVRLRRTKTKDEVSTRSEVFAGARNKKLISQLQREGDRTLPLAAVVVAAQPAAVQPVAAAPAAVAAAVDGPGDKAPDPAPAAPAPRPARVAAPKKPRPAKPVRPPHRGASAPAVPEVPGGAGGGDDVGPGAPGPALTPAPAPISAGLEELDDSALDALEDDLDDLDGEAVTAVDTPAAKRAT